MQHDDGAADAAVAHQEIAAEPDRRQRFIGRQLADERREIVAIGRHVDALARPAAAPARVARERDVARQRAAQRGERLRLVHHHAPSAAGRVQRMARREQGRRLADRARAHRDDDVAVAHERAIASGSSAVASTNTGSTLPATRTARASARPSAATIGGSPAG